MPLTIVRTGCYYSFNMFEYQNGNAENTAAQSDQKENQKEIVLDENTALRFCDLESFNPRPSTKEALPLPNSLQKLIHEGRNNQCTEAEDIRPMLEFIQSYLKSEVGKKLLGASDALSIEVMTPGVAVKFCVALVASLAKYAYHELPNARDISERYAPTKADTKSASALLSESLAHHDDVSWAGLGVCRNFARSVKVVFEAMRRMNKGLNNTHCAYVWGYDYKQKSEFVSKQNIATEEAHAWNIFISLNEPAQASLTIVDATWAEFDAEEGSLKKADYTGTRMVPLMETCSKYAKNPETALSCLRYFDNIIAKHKSILESMQHEADHLCATKRGAACLKARRSLQRAIDFQDYYLWKSYSIFIDFRRRNKDTVLPTFHALRDAFPGYQKRFKNEIGRWAITELPLSDNGGLISLETAVATILDQKKWSYLLRSWRSQPSIFVRCVLDELAKRPNFPDLLKKETDLRMIVREVRPELLPPFDPREYPADFDEFKSLLKVSVFLKKHLARYIRAKYSASSLHHLRPEDVIPIDEMARNILLSIDRVEAEDLMRSHDTFSLMTHFDELYSQLKKSRMHGSS